MTNIRITQTPPGTAAPENIRKQWVGIEMTTVLNGNQNAPGWKSDLNQGGHIVDIDVAINALHEAGKVEAADFWTNMKEMFGQQLRFSDAVCEVLEA